MAWSWIHFRRRPLSRSFNRVVAFLEGHKVEFTTRKTSETARTAHEAAAAIGCELSQICKSIVLHMPGDDQVAAFITSGINKVDMTKVEGLLGQPVRLAGADLVRRKTGFVIGGVPPFAHAEPVRSFMDPLLLTFSIVWAAAGTPYHVLGMDPNVLKSISKAEVQEFTESPKS